MMSDRQYIVTPARLPDNSHW